MTSTVRDHLFIVISGDNANALGVIRGLGEAGVKPILIYLEEDSHLPMLIRSKYLTTVHKVRSYEEGVDLLIKSYSNRESKPFVYTCDDTIQSIFDNRYSELEGQFFFFNAGEEGRINELMNKHVICELAESCGFRIPKQEVVKKGEFPKTLQYPIITKTLKSIWGAWKADSFICQNEEELREAYTKISGEDLLLQEFIEKKTELDFEGFSIRGGEEVFIPYQITYIRLPKGSYGHYTTCKVFDDTEMMKKLRELLKRCRYSGCFEIEFLVDHNDRLWFLEVNFRFSAWNYALTFGGLNYPTMWAESTLAGKLILPEDSAFSSLPIRQSFTAMSEPGDFGQQVVMGNSSLWKWIQDLFKADMLYVFNPRDMKPALSFWYHKLIRKVTRKK